MLRLKSKYNPIKMIKFVIAALLLATGVYLLLLAFSPALNSYLTNPDNNQTTKLLASKESIPDEPRLYIPSIDINVPYSTGDALVMEHGAWWRNPDNGNPKDGGNFVLSAHRFIMGLTPEQTLRKSPFYNIDKLKIGDEIIVDYQGERYAYAIDKIFAVKPDAIEIERKTDEPQLTLYSCTLGGAADGREVIIAKPKTLPVN